MMPPSSRPLSAEDVELVDQARRAIDANTDAGPGEDGVHTMGALFELRTAECSLE